MTATRSRARTYTTTTIEKRYNMKDTLKYNPYIDPPDKAKLLRDRVELMSRILNDWCEMLIFDSIVFKRFLAVEYRFRDISNINARLSEYAQFTRGEM